MNFNLLICSGKVPPPPPTTGQRKFVEQKNAVIKIELSRCLNRLDSTEKISVENDRSKGNIQIGPQRDKGWKECMRHKWEHSGNPLYLLLEPLQKKLVVGYM